MVTRRKPALAGHDGDGRARVLGALRGVRGNELPGDVVQAPGGGGGIVIALRGRVVRVVARERRALGVGGALGG